MRGGTDPLTSDGAIAWRGFDLLYAACLLCDGYGFEEEEESIEFVGEVGGIEVECADGWISYCTRERSAPRGAKSAAHLRPCRLARSKDRPLAASSMPPPLFCSLPILYRFIAWASPSLNCSQQ